jgi:hypothetical protein
MTIFVIMSYQEKGGEKRRFFDNSIFTKQSRNSKNLEEVRFIQILYNDWTFSGDEFKCKEKKEVKYAE